MIFPEALTDQSFLASEILQKYIDFYQQKIAFLDDESIGMLHHALLVQRKHSQDPENECFWRKTVIGQHITQLTQKGFQIPGKTFEQG